MPTNPLSAWISDFGREYTDRNARTLQEIDAAFRQQFGVTKSDIYRRLVGPDRLPGGAVLEVGCNLGMELRLLERANPGLDFHGLDPQRYAIDKARQAAPHMHFYEGTAFEIPFADRHFDLVMTHGVLIHIHPDDLPKAMAEIHRVTKRFILAHEYYAPEPREIRYHGQPGLLWKADFAARYKEQFPTLETVAVEYYPYSVSTGGPDLCDQVSLFEKVGD